MVHVSEESQFSLPCTCLSTAEKPRDARVTSICKIAKWNFQGTLFRGLRGNVDASCVRRWKKRGQLPIGNN